MSSKQPRRIVWINNRLVHQFAAIVFEPVLLEYDPDKFAIDGTRDIAPDGAPPELQPIKGTLARVVDRGIYTFASSHAARRFVRACNGSGLEKAAFMAIMPQDARG